MHLGRSAPGVAALALWFYAIGALPLGTAMTLNFSSPLSSTAFVIAATLASRRRVPWVLAACVATGFVVGLLSGLLSAAAYRHVRELGRIGEPEWRTVFYFSPCGCVLGLVGSLPQVLIRHHTPAGLLMLFAVGVRATLAQLAMTRAYGRGRTVLTANLQFSAIVFAALLGVALFGDQVGYTGWLGIGIIIASCVVATALVARRRSAPALEPTILTANK